MAYTKHLSLFFIWYSSALTYQVVRIEIDESIEKECQKVCSNVLDKMFC